MLSRSVESQGVSFTSSKSKPFSITSEAWNYIKHNINIKNNMPIHSYNTKARVKWIRFGFRCTFATQNRNWEHIRFSEISEFELFDTMFSSYSGYVIIKSIPSE